MAFCLDHNCIPLLLKVGDQHVLIRASTCMGIAHRKGYPFLDFFLGNIERHFLEPILHKIFFRSFPLQHMLGASVCLLIMIKGHCNTFCSKLRTRWSKCDAFL